MFGPEWAVWCWGTDPGDPKTSERAAVECFSSRGTHTHSYFHMAAVKKLHKFKIQALSADSQTLDSC